MEALLHGSVLDSLPSQLAVIDHTGTVVLVNDAWRRFAEVGGCTTCAPGVNFFEVCQRAYGPASVEAARAADGLREVLTGASPSFSMDLACETPRGLQWYAEHVVPLGGGEAGAIVTFTDITDRKRHEALSEHRATHDVLTGLPNRVLIHDRLAQAIAGSRRTTSAVAVLFVDVDRFKKVNDLYGHAMGDAVLVELARRLRHCVRPSDTVGRLAGDEFVIICNAGPADTAVTEIAARVSEVMTEPFHVAGHHLAVGVSVGIHVADRWEGSPEDLLHLADTAMFRAKSRGGGRTELSGRLSPASFPASPPASPPPSLPAFPTRVPRELERFKVAAAGGGEAEAVARLLHLLRVTINMDVAWISEFLGPEQVFRFVDAEPGVTGPSAGTRLPMSGAYCARVLAGTMPPVIRDTHADPAGALLPVTYALHIGAYLGVPLHGLDGTPSGMVCATSSTVRPDLDEEDLRSARLIADVIDDQLRRAADGAAARWARSDLRETVLTFCRGPGRTLVLQPVVDLRTGRTVAVEALTRFDGAERDPAQWFATAATLGLGRPLEVAAAASALRHEAVASLPAVCVNLSPDVILDGALDELLVGHDPARVIVELTEHAPVSSYEDLEDALARHLARGLRVAVDDVGAGHASLRHVVRLRPDVLKIDMSLIRGIDADPVRRSLVAAIGSVSHGLHATVVAEGVETPAELQTLRDLGVDQGQGYLFGRPSVPA